MLVVAFAQARRTSWKRFLRSVTPDSVAREARLTSRVHHTNVVRLLGACTDAAARDMHGNELGLCLVMELAQRSLRALLSAPEVDNPLCDRNVDQQLRKRLLFLAGIANGLRALHSNTPAPIVHGDVKPENLLVVEDSRTAPRPLVCDLGFSTRGEEQAGGTLIYQAPELLAGDRPTPASDVFACGLLMWEVATFGRDGGLWAGQPQAAIIRAVSNGQRPPLTHHCQPPELQTLISRCWDQRPERRPSMAEVAEVLTLLTGQIAVRSTAQSTVSVVRSMPWRFRDHPLSSMPGVVTVGPARFAELVLGATAVTDPATIEGQVRALVRSAAPSNAGFNTRYQLHRVMLYESFASETAFFSRLAELSARHPWDAPASPFRPTWHQPSFERLGVTLNQTADQIAWRRHIAEAFQLYASLCARLPPAVSLPGVRVHTVFHCPSGGWDIALQICSSGFAQLSTTDAGFFAQVNLLPQLKPGTHTCTSHDPCPLCISCAGLLLLIRP